ncbi:multidrug resistance-associated protein [Coniochaeta ligniaria NRRL 30616]|uniref:Multidrug resistance-associated protein n=1 Tax=Coniochaeta ligniaria NRRL 30616 TaxID=1408157 RepID=A0A1J7IYR8_9PEZI|nr:multidrug resistance-associated protein [Coniochaeta ligniaria NRRL 30616]
MPSRDLLVRRVDNLKHLVAQASSPATEWIDGASRVAKSGYLQSALLVAVSIWAATSAIRQTQTSTVRPSSKWSRIRLPYEISSQISRTAALVFIIIAACQTGGQWLNVAMIGLAFVLGLLRLANDPRWRHSSLHQVNTLLAGSFLLLSTAEILPMIQLSSDHAINKSLLGTVVGLAIANAVALITPREWVPPDVTSVHFRLTPSIEPAPEETCSWFNYFIWYEWLTPTIWKGARKPIEMADLPGLPWYDEPLYLLSEMNTARHNHRKTFRALISFQGRELITMAMWVASSYALELVAPFGMYHLLDYLSAPDRALLHPAVWLFLMFAGPLGRSITFQGYIFRSTRLIVRIKSAMTQELYHRAMTSMELEEDVVNAIVSKDGKTPQVQQSTSNGRLANLMASDIDAITNARDTVAITCGVPVGMTLSLIGLYQVVGWASLVGICFMVLAIPLPAWISQRMASSQRKVKVAQDSRISLISEYLGSIKAIKYFAWEDAMIKRISEARRREQKDLWHISILVAFMGSVGDLIPLIALLAIFTLYAGVLKKPLTAPIAFTTLTLVMTMRRNIMMFSYLSRNITSAIISFERLDRFFENTTPLTHYPTGPLSIKHATFRRNKRATFLLRDISLDFVEGGLNVVTGQSGSGKTTLLLAILGETLLEDGSVTRPEDIAFASQTAWLQSESIRDNILFHSPFEQSRYDRVIEACCLEIDFSELPQGDRTEVGENGATLSAGGQRSRVALARALYSKASVLLLDDIFAALDTKTAASLWKLCFCSDMLKGRTTVLVTQMPWVSAQADLAITLENGGIKTTEQHLGVVRKPVTSEEEIGLIENGNADSGINGTEPGKIDVKSPVLKAKQDEITNEMKASGASARLMFFKYMLHFGGPAYALFALLTIVLSNAALIATSFWLSIWVNAYDRQEAVNITFYLGIYALFTLGSAIIDCLGFLTFANGQWIAARNLHKQLINAVMNVSLSWWKDVPVGRVVNRFSRDMNSLDSDLGRMLQYFLGMAVKIFFRIGAISSILPIFMLPGLVTCFIGVLCGEMYTRTAVMVKRLVSSSQSPVFSQFSDSLMGLAVIRARSNMPVVFGDKLAERLRLFSRATEANYNCNRWVSVRIDFITALVTLCAGIIAVSKAGTLPAGLVGFSLLNAAGLSETILGLVRAMNELEVELQSFHRVQEYVQLVPEEKTDDVHDASSSPDLTAIEAKDWPQTGSIEFRNVTIRYDLDGPDILKDVNLKFQAGERVAVVGRTGSGKSTLVLSMLHFTNIVSGTILYDGIDITLIPRKKLRQAITIIPQEAVLFHGTVGSNLDPSGDIPSERLEDAISACGNIASFNFRDAAETNRAVDTGNGTTVVLPGIDDGPTETTPLLLSTNGTTNGIQPVIPTNTTDQPKPSAISSGLSLSTPVLPNGSNFSHGQRQVLSLCRALVRKSRLMLLDEATASMDYETDQGIQAVLRKEMDRGREGDQSRRTLVTIAHRLRTIVDYDKVVVMGGGRVLEVGRPKELYKGRGTFYDMVRFSGEGEDLVMLMEE